MSKLSNLNCEMSTAGSCTPAATMAAPKAAPVRIVAIVLCVRGNVLVSKLWRMSGQGS